MFPNALHILSSDFCLPRFPSSQVKKSSWRQSLEVAFDFTPHQLSLLFCKSGGRKYICFNCCPFRCNLVYWLYLKCTIFPKKSV